jgi:hypothetical protein
MTANVSASTANTPDPPMSGISMPPAMGPAVRPMPDVSDRRLFAQERSASETRFGTAAPNAGQTGAPSSEAMKTRPIMSCGAETSATAAKTAALPSSQTMIRRRRSTWSASQPASGVRKPTMPKETR